MASVKRCISCREEIQERDWFCEKCGTWNNRPVEGQVAVSVAAASVAEPSASAPTVRCPHCGVEGLLGETVCRQCETPLLEGTLGDPQASATATVTVALSDGRTADIQLSSFMLGREPEFPLAEELSRYLNVSRRHVLVAIQGDRTMITDLGSTNGTSVDGHPISPWQPSEVLEGQTIRLGADCALRLSTRGPRSI